MHSSAEVEYTHRSGENGFYLGLVDLKLLADHYGAQVLCLHFDDSSFGFPNLVPLNEILNGMCKGRCEMEKGPEPDLSSHKTWVVAWCKATYERSEFLSLNHVLPLFSRAQIGDTWESVADPIRNKFAQRVTKLRQQIAVCQDDSDDGIKLSLEDRLHTLESKKAFMDLILDNDFLPVDVPADGNCLLWSVRCLRAGWVLQKQMSNNASIEESRSVTGL